MSSSEPPWPLRWEDDALLVLDQTLLPGEQRVLRLSRPDEVLEAIAHMRVRGAPAIGIAAAYGIALAALRAHECGADPRAAAREAAVRLRAARPTAVNLAACVDRMAALVARGASPERVVSEAGAIHAEDLGQSRRLIEHGLPLLLPRGRYLTHCHTGPLATGGGGTALGVLLAGHRRGLVEHVWVDETRPRLQGARLTALELERAGVPFTLVVDAAAAGLLARGAAHQVWVGADRVACNGDVINKVGTYALSLACAAHEVPLYAAFPWSTFDPALASAAGCPIEERDEAEVLESEGRRLAAPSAHAHNPAFDATPARLVSAWVSDRGVARTPADLARQAGEPDASRP